MNFFLIALGGAAGSVLRYLCQKWVSELYRHSFPLGTFLVNIAGCFLIGLFYALSERSQVFSANYRLLLITGFCGGFTTFSTFSFENMSLLRSGDYGYFLLYTLGSVLTGLLSVYGGTALGKQFHL